MIGYGYTAMHSALRKAIERGIKPGELVFWNGPGSFVCHDGSRRLHHIVSAVREYTAEQSFQIAALSEMGLDKIVYVDESEWEPNDPDKMGALQKEWRKDV